MLYIDSINSALHELMDSDRNVVMIGEDLLDPYGGAFKASRGLSTKFPKQIISTPISEQAIVGMAIGMSMRGMRPIVEIMFGDFITLCVDQIVNHASKYNWMFNGQVNVPIVIRTPMGGGRGYGPTHSQSLESLFMSVSGIRICAPSIYHNPGNLLKNSVLENQHPLIFIENKSEYSEKLYSGSTLDNNMQLSVIQKEGVSETILISAYPNEVADVVIVTYGGMARIAVEAALEIFIKEEVIIHVVVPSMIRHIPIKDILPSVEKSGRVLILEEGNKIGGWGAEVSSQINENISSVLLYPVQRMGSEDFPIPSALPLEKEILPTKKKVVDMILKMI
jgi:pyruvate/2-oxoglutarate/acetoin dehydrogenase E1 component